MGGSGEAHAIAQGGVRSGIGRQRWCRVGEDGNSNVLQCSIVHGVKRVDKHVVTKGACGVLKWTAQPHFGGLSRISVQKDYPAYPTQSSSRPWAFARHPNLPMGPNLCNRITDAPHHLQHLPMSHATRPTFCFQVTIPKNILV